MKINPNNALFLWGKNGKVIVYRKTVVCSIFG